jgi:toxin YoeB
MTYTLRIDRIADIHFQKIKKSGDKITFEKLKKILLELQIHPKTGIGNPEQLKHNLSGYWSRRINKRDRIIYQIIEEPDNLVVVISALGHY